MTNLTYAGESNSKSPENIKSHILRLFIFYLSLSFIFLLLLSVANVRLFNSLNLGMTLISGGGFLPTDNLSNIISTNLQKTVLIFMFFLSITNFYLIFNLFNTRVLLNSHKEDMYLIGLITILTFLILFNDFDIFDLLISILSSLANSGLTIVSSDNNLGLYFLFITIVGGSLVSNTSGIKLARLYILLKITSSEIIKLISPNSVINLTIFNSENKINDDNIRISFLIFISFFLSLFILSSLLIIDDIGFERSFKLSILTLTNTVNSELHNLQNFSFSKLLTSSKLVLITFMIIGKIELISIFLIIKRIFFKD